MKLSILNALKKAFENSTQGNWRSIDYGTQVVRPYDNPVAISGESFDTVANLRPYDDGSINHDGEFIALSHNLMPDLLEAVSMLERVVNEAEAITKGTTTWPFAHRLIEKFKQSENETVAKTYKVNMYAYVTVPVRAKNAKSAAIIAVNNSYSWDIDCNKYDVSWSVNEVMMIDVYGPDDTDTGEFEYASLSGKKAAPFLNDEGYLYEVCMYFNAEVIVDDAEDEEDAISNANGAGYTGNITSESQNIKWDWSESVESSIVDSES